MVKSTHGKIRMVGYTNVGVYIRWGLQTAESIHGGFYTHQHTIFLLAIFSIVYSTGVLVKSGLILG